MRRREKVYAVLAIVSSFIAGVGLILLSVFDTARHSSLHRLFLLIFMVGVILSAIFTVVEVRLHCQFHGRTETECLVCSIDGSAKTTPATELCRPPTELRASSQAFLSSSRLRLELPCTKGSQTSLVSRPPSSYPTHDGI